MYKTIAKIAVKSKGVPLQQSYNERFELFSRLTMLILPVEKNDYGMMIKNT